MSQATEHSKFLFVVGCPRSGTTWVQLLLAQHPHVATSQETHLFTNYLNALEKCWQGEKRQPLRRRTGLSGLLLEEEFYELCQSFAVGVFKKVKAGNINSCLLVDKSPDHVRRADLILKVLPDASFLHVIRDPRSVVSSLRHAGRTWGRDWAPTSTAGCALRWQGDIRLGRQIACKTTRYMEIQYETLLERGSIELARILDWLDLPADAEFCRAAVATCSFQNLKTAKNIVNSPWQLEDEPEGMYRQGRADSWRDDLTRTDVRIVEFIALDEMRKLGYEPVSRHPERRPLRLCVRAAVKAAAAMVRPLVLPVWRRFEQLVKS